MGRRLTLAVAIAAILASVSIGGAIAGDPRSGPAPGIVAAAASRVTVGSSYSDAVPKAAFRAMMGFCAAQTGVTPSIRTVDHTKFQDSITAYLKGTPGDIFTWFAGYRMRSLAPQKLVRAISDVWAGIADHYTPAMKALSTAADGKQYFVPMYTYPWVFLYRKSLFAENGYTVPATFDDLIALARGMQADGLVPLASADKDGWPAMGTFDILDMRLNGYRFHRDLMAGKAKWTDPRVKAVLELWRLLLP